MTQLRKIRVSNGIHWVEAPEAGLRILCGAPADSLKHLMRRGLIVPTEKNGVTFDTGPNAILLSDVLVQNGDFANLAEFPVLHMLYLQGMMLPNHPNNDGSRPLLIGEERQVRAQMEYIFRGNYGLTTIEEIEASGIPRPRAEEMMAIKLKFAFGRIRSSEELLDLCILGEAPAELRGGLSVRRLARNVFEFALNGETLEVDLNLALHERYEPPYSLGFHHIKREHFAVIHSGDGDGWDVNRPCTSSILMHHGNIYLVDTGPNILYSLTALGIGINEVRGVFHTHCHDDHFAGITTLIQAGYKMRFFSTPLIRASVVKKLSALMSIGEDRFNDFFQVVDLEFDTWNDIDGLEVKPLFSPHPVETNIYLFRSLGADGYRTYAHFADIAAFGVLDKMADKDDGGTGITRAACQRIKAEYLTTADIKKIDIGGGMIHGTAEDFRADRSATTILSHTAKPLTARQKEIGADAPFGTTHVLIPDHTDIARRTAFEYLRAYFPDASRPSMRDIMNNRLVTVNPGTIFIREGQPNEEMYLILSGIVERIRSDCAAAFPLSAGAIVGEYSGLHQAAAMATYRSASFVQKLCIPCHMYRAFVERNALAAKIEHLHDIRAFLQTTWLFGEEIPYLLYNEIAEQAVGHDLEPEDGIVDRHNGDSLYIVKWGKAERIADGKVEAVLEPGDFLGEEKIIAQPARPFSLRALEPTRLVEIPGRILRRIPITTWKLLEAYQRRAC